MDQIKLSIQDVSHSFVAKNGQSLKILSALTIQVKQGEFVSLIGPSGCGKSTLFHLIAGLAEPTTGHIMLDGDSPSERLGQAGYMPQKPLLLPWKTVRQNVLLGAQLQNQLDHSTNKQADKLLKQFGLKQFAGRYPHALSGGMAQKAALLRTIISGKDFWLMDEPFGALDAITRLSMQQWLLEVWRQQQATALLITHDIREAILLSDRIYVLSQRPATVMKEVTVNLPRPRCKEMLARKNALQLEAELEELLVQP